MKYKKLLEVENESKKLGGYVFTCDRYRGEEEKWPHLKS